MKKIILLTLILIIFASSSFGLIIGDLFGLKAATRKVTVQGEVIGDVMIRGENAWINIKDAKGAIGIWTTAKQAESITTAGDYKHTGDWIEVEGVFNKQCQLHGGDTDIHAVTIKVIKEGLERDISIRPAQISFAIITFIIFAVLYLLRRYISKKTIRLASKK